MLPEKRRRPISLAMMEVFFDETHEDNVERRMAIADCMNLSLREAVEESGRRAEDKIT
jgi:hypothetical protein